MSIPPPILKIKTPLEEDLITSHKIKPLLCLRVHKEDLITNPLPKEDLITSSIAVPHPVTINGGRISLKIVSNVATQSSIPKETPQPLKLKILPSLEQEMEEHEPEFLEEIQNPNSQYFCYLLKSLTTSKTYVGYTIDPCRRLRQHNGEIVGGAKATQYGRPWKIVGYITGMPTSTSALMLEWRLHHPPIKRYNVTGRIQTIAEVLALDRWTTNSPLTNTLSLKMIWLETGRRLPFCPICCKEFYLNQEENVLTELSPLINPLPTPSSAEILSNKSAKRKFHRKRYPGRKDNRT